MKINYRQGDLFASPHRVLVHGCNAQGVMGGGVAWHVRDQFPEAYDQYRQQYLDQGELALGTIIPVETNGRIIVNAVTQQHFGAPPARYVSYDAVSVAMAAVDAWCRENGYAEFAMPRIGAGLGGGDWQVIESVVECAVTHTQVWVYDLEAL